MFKVDYLMFFLLVMSNKGSETASIDTKSKDPDLAESILGTASYLENLQDDQTGFTPAETTKVTRRAFVVRCCAHITCNGVRRGNLTKGDVTAPYTQPMIMITRLRATPTFARRPMFQPGPKRFLVVNQQPAQPRRVLVLQQQPRVMFVQPQQVPRPPVFVVQQPPPQVPGQTYRVIQPPPSFVFPRLPGLPFENFFVNLINEFLRPVTFRVPATAAVTINATTSHAGNKASKQQTTVGKPATDEGDDDGEEENQPTDIPIKNGNNVPPTVTEAGGSENTLVGGDGEELTPGDADNQVGTDEITAVTTQNPKEKLRATQEMDRIKREADESTIEPWEYEESTENFIDDDDVSWAP